MGYVPVRSANNASATEVAAALEAAEVAEVVEAAETAAAVEVAIAAIEIGDMVNRLEFVLDLMVCALTCCRMHGGTTNEDITPCTHFIMQGNTQAHLQICTHRQE